MPLLVISDGVPGSIMAIAECFPESKRQGCTFYSLRKIRYKLPRDVIDELYPQVRFVCYRTDAEIAKLYAGKIIDGYAEKYPSAIRCLQEDFETCIQHMTFPAGHRKHIFVTNPLERESGEQKRRKNAIPRFFDEKRCLKLVYATMVRARPKWRRVKMSGYGLTLQRRNIRKKYEREVKDDGCTSKKSAVQPF